MLVMNLKDQNRLRHLVGTWRTMGTFTPRYVSLIEQSMRARTPPPPPQQDDAYLRGLLAQLQQNKPAFERMSLEQARLPQNRKFYNQLLQYVALNRNRNRPPPMVQHQRPPMMQHQRPPMMQHQRPPHMNVVPQQYASHQMQPSYPETKTTSSDVLINRLYGGHQDLTTGLRFPSEKDPRYATYLDLRFKKSQHLAKMKEDGVMSSRSWFCDAKEWETQSLIELREIEQKTAYSSFEDPDAKEEEEDDSNDSNVVCINKKLLNKPNKYDISYYCNTKNTLISINHLIEFLKIFKIELDELENKYEPENKYDE